MTGRLDELEQCAGKTAGDPGAIASVRYDAVSPRLSRLSGVVASTAGWLQRIQFGFLALLTMFLLAGPAEAGTGTSTDPFTSLADAYSVSASGRYSFNLGSGTFAADVDTSEGRGWVLVAQYVHQANTNPPLSVLGAGSDLPVTSGAALGTNESGIPARWGHAGNAAMSQFTGAIETRWFGRTSAHTRVVHFRTQAGADYIRTGIGSMTGLSSAFTALTGHSANIPATGSGGYTNKGDYALTNFPFFDPASRHWGIRGEGGDAIGGPGNNGDRWEVDDFPNNSSRSTIHRIWVRAVDPGLVINTSDTGTGSLRAAITWANSSPGPNTISFKLAGPGPHTITLASALPQMTATGLTIDGTTQPGTQCRDLWAGTGHDLRVNVRGSAGDGFQLGAANQTVRGLSFSGFENAIRLLSTSSTPTIQCNYIGLLANGTSSGNTRGLWVSGDSARIGSLDYGQGNIISSNSIVGVLTTEGSTDTSIRGNFIGTDATGMSARANGTGINNFFGTATWRDITWNLISGNNGNAGIRLEADDRITPSNGQIRIQRNRIGFNRTLTDLLRNGGDGLGFLEGSITDVLIGGVASTEGNEIASDGDGIDIRQATNVVIQGNTIARSGEAGIRLNNVNGATIGGDAATLGNIIGGNNNEGIFLLGGSRNVAIRGNTIGPATITGATFNNRLDGILLITVSTVTIGDGTASGRNVIGGNRGRAINGSGTNSNITINGNFIGTDASGNAPAVNGQDIAVVGARDAIAFGQNGSFTNLSVLNNVIGGYQAAMVEFWSGTGNGLTLQGNNFGVGADGVSQIVSGNVNDLIFTGGAGNFSNVLIGGSSPGQGNLIAFSAVSGILLNNDGSNIQVIGNTIRNNARNGIELANTTRAAIISNRIFDNGLLGIDLGNNGVGLNDAGDGDSGPNDFLNFPEITSVNVTGPNELAYNFTLDVPASVNGYRVEFFADDTADPSGYGEGERYLAHVDVTHGGGAQSYSGTLSTPGPLSVGDSISATATRRTAGGAWDITSEFSAVASASGMAELSASMSSDLFEPPPDRPFATPGNDVILSTTVSNIGTGYTDVDSIFAVLSVSSDNIFYNGVTPSLGGVAGFESASPFLTFTPASDLAFSNSAARPASFAQCTYLPEPGYDPLVQHVCFNPKGALPNGSPDGRFTVRIRARIR